MSPKNKKIVGLWKQCVECKTCILMRDEEQHANDCPPDESKHLYDFVRNSVLHGCAGVKTNDDIKNILQHDIDNMVFLSPSAIEICNFAIGEHAEIKYENVSAPIARMIWPTKEKSTTSVLFTKSTMDLLSLKSGTVVSISPIKNIKEASFITLIILHGDKELELSKELHTRLLKNYVEKLIAKTNILSMTFYGRIIKFFVKEVTCASCENLERTFEEFSICDSVFYQISKNTKFYLYKSEAEYKKKTVLKDSVDQIGGLDKEIAEISELIEMGLELSDQTFNFRTAKACLLHGNAGTGKTLLLNALSMAMNVHCIHICSVDLYTKYSANIDEALNNCFEEAEDRSPSIVIFDEFDVLCPSRSNRMTESEKRIVSRVLSFFDSVNCSNNKIFILGTTNKIDSIDPSFRRCGRFDREIEIPSPGPLGRFDILKKLLKDIPTKLTEECVREIAYNTHGFVGADLVALCSKATLHAARYDKVMIDVDDFKFALTAVRPSAMREVQIEMPNVKWSDIGGQDNIKLILRQAVEWPLKYGESFARLGITPPKGVLMYGPPGCSKTMIAKALATESGLNFLSINGPELFSKWVGESEKAVRDVFRKARQVAPSIIFFDEIDALGGERSTSSNANVQERVLAQLLTELDGITPLVNVTILAATNRPDKIDKALIRPGRLDRIVYVPLPDAVTRKEIFKIKFSKMPVVDVDLDDIVSKTEQYSGAEVNAVCEEAGMAALEEDLNAEHITMPHFLKALDLIQPRTPSNLINLYEDYVKMK